MRFSRLSHPARVGGIAVALIVLALLTAGPLRGLRSDIAAQKVDVDAQRAIVGTQLETLRTQLEVTRRQLDIATEQLELARKQGRLTETLVGMQRELLQIARRTLAQVEEINRKTPDVDPRR